MSTKKKVLMLICFPLTGCGSGVFTKETAAALNKNGKYEVAIVCPPSDYIKTRMRTYDLNLPFKVAFTGYPHWPNCMKYKDLTPLCIQQLLLSFSDDTAKAIEDFKPDLIQVHHTSLLLKVASDLKSIYDIPYIVTSHGTGVAAASENIIYRKLLKEPLEQASAILPVSKNTSSWLMQTFSIAKKRNVKIIHGGTAIVPEYSNIKNKPHKMVLFVGKITKQKGVQYIIEAAEKINGQIKIVGDGPFKTSVEKMSLKKNLKNVTFMGYFSENKRKQLLRLYQQAAVVVIPSIWAEPMPLVMMDALASGTPVIASRVGGISSVIKNNKNGFLVPPGDSNAIKIACNKILSNADLQQKLSINALGTIRGEYHWTDVANEYQTIYDKILKKRYKNTLLERKL